LSVIGVAVIAADMIPDKYIRNQPIT